MPDADKDAAVKAAIRTILPGLRVANYVERWSPASPAIQALTILSEYVGEGPIVAGDLVDPDVPTAHACRPEGRGLEGVDISLPITRVLPPGGGRESGSSR